MKKKTRRRGKIINGGLRPDTDEIYKRGWTILTGRNLSANSSNQSAKSSEPEKPKQAPKRKPVK